MKKTSFLLFVAFLATLFTPAHLFAQQLETCGTPLPSGQWVWPSGGYCTPGQEREVPQTTAPVAVATPDATGTPESHSGATSGGPTTQPQTNIVTNNGIRRVSPVGGQGAWALAQACGISLDAFKQYNNLVGSNPIIKADQIYYCEDPGTGTPEPGNGVSATTPDRSVEDGDSFTITTEQTWSEAALKCTNANTGASDLLSPNVNPGIGYPQPGTYVTCPMYNYSNDPTPGAVIVSGTTDTWAVEEHQVRVRATSAIAIGGSYAFTPNYTANAVAVVELTESGMVLGYLFPVVAGATGITIIALTSARQAIDSSYVIAMANANADAGNHAQTTGQTSNPVPPNCDGAYEQIRGLVEWGTDLQITIPRSILSGGAASVFSAAITILQSPLCQDFYGAEGNATQWYIWRK